MNRLVLSGGFADPVRAAQGAFRALAEALSRPARPVALPGDVEPPAPLTREIGVIALTLADHETPIWLDAELSAARNVSDWLRFQTGAPITTDPGEAAFALVRHPSRMPALSAFALGSDEYPDCSTTLIIAIDAFAAAAPVRLSGPGLREPREFAAAPLPPAFWSEAVANRAGYARGVDILFAGGGKVAGLPRSTRIEMLEAEPCMSR